MFAPEGLPQAARSPHNPIKGVARLALGGFMVPSIVQEGGKCEDAPNTVRGPGICVRRCAGCRLVPATAPAASSSSRPAAEHSSMTTTSRAPTAARRRPSRAVGSPLDVTVSGLAGVGLPGSPGRVDSGEGVRTPAIEPL
jgi:hypothetical protein